MQKNGKNIWLKMPMVGMAALLVSFCFGIVADDFTEQEPRNISGIGRRGDYAGKSN